MKRLILTAIVIACLCIPLAGAYNSGSNLTMVYFGQTIPVTVGPYSAAEADAICKDMGYSGKWTGSTYGELSYNAANGLIDNNLVNYGSSKVSSTNANQVYILATSKCAESGGTYVARKQDFFVAQPILLTLVPSKNNMTIPDSITFTLGISYSSEDLSINFGDGTSNFYPAGTTKPSTLSHNYTSSGEFAVTLQGHMNPSTTRTNTTNVSVRESDFSTSFSATPTNGSTPLTTVFTALNLTNTTGTSWSFGDGNVTATSLTSFSHLYQNPGIYTVRMDYYNYTGGAKYVQKNNYITVGAPNATSTTHAVARDLYTGFAINGAQVGMYDVENTSWTNTTAINGEGSITTLLGHTINIYGSATGYDDDNLIGVPEVDGGYYSLLLKPTNLTTHNVTPGNLTLAVTVQDLQIPHQTLSGAEVTAAWGAQYASGTSNAAGSVFFTVPNNTAIHLSAFKSGYASGSSTHITGTANGGSTMETAIVYIGTDYVTPVPSVTLTTGPGGTIPQTVDPYPCIGDGSAQDTANCQRKQGSMAADLISYGPDLVKFFIMLTFIGGLLLITGKR